VRASVGSELFPKVLGTYELELHGVIAELIGMRPDIVIDVGAAEGYYAVGLATRLPNSRIRAFESEQVGRELLVEMARRNSVADRVDVYGKCAPIDLARAIIGAARPALVVDVEGDELPLLNPESVPALKRAWILVELHSFVNSRIPEVICSRFQESHRLTKLEARPRVAGDWPKRPLVLRCLPVDYTLRFVDERRPPGMSWCWMIPKCPN
jgi:hypothetical protein